MGAARTTVAMTGAMIGLDCIWLYMLLHVANQGLGLAVPVFTLFILFGASLAWMLALRGLARWLRVLRHSWIRTSLSWMAWPVATFLLLLGLFKDTSGMVASIEETLFIVVAAGVLWALGARPAGTRPTHRDVLIEFQFGLVMLAIAFFIGYAVGADLRVAVPLAIGFIGLGLLVAAVTGGGRAAAGGTDGATVSIDDAGGGAGAAAGVPGEQTGRGGAWWGMLLIGLVLVLVLGIIAGLIFTPELMQYVGRGLRAIWGLFDRMIGAIGGLFSSSSSESALPPPPEVEAPLPPDSDGGLILALPEWMRRPANIAYAVILSVLVLAAIWSIASQLLTKMRRRSAEGAQVESLRGAFRQDLLAALRRVFGWVGRLFGFFGRRRARDEDPQTASIRRLYADLLRWGEAAGFPRDPSQTPFEYQEVLCLALPGRATEVRSITQSYVLARYGALPPTDAELRGLRESRGRLKRGRGGRDAASRGTGHDGA